MRRISLLAGFLIVASSGASAVAEPLIWGIQAEQLEIRRGESNENVFAWDFDALVGSDELKLVWRSQAEVATGTGTFETLENQLRLQKPISTFFDAVLGVRVDTPRGPDRTYGVVGIKGLAPQWFEIDADLYVSDNPVFRFEAEYEALITNRIILTPSFEIDLPFADDRPIAVGAWGSKIEVGARLSYDLIDRLISPYLGISYERAFGETADFRRAEGEDNSTLFFVVGTRVLF
ncbi:MAG: copper resistance protein B [Proteobacteria bacterium]|nr:copper resistance protein B [Pseudomonadota bacterium]MDA1059926.1 copper resistance protein B [Pseudomonadota bacterium]